MEKSFVIDSKTGQNVESRLYIYFFDTKILFQMSHEFKVEYKPFAYIFHLYLVYGQALELFSQ
jgi:hypothetical protein